MYLHIGRNVLVSQADIVAILDLEAIRDNVASREFLELAATEGRVRAGMPGEAKSCVVTGQQEIYYSPIASVTLARRLEHGWRGFLGEAEAEP